MYFYQRLLQLFIWKKKKKKIYEGYFLHVKLDSLSSFSNLTSPLRNQISSISGIINEICCGPLVTVHFVGVNKQRIHPEWEWLLFYPFTFRLRKHALNLYLLMMTSIQWRVKIKSWKKITYLSTLASRKIIFTILYIFWNCQLAVIDQVINCIHVHID